MGPRGPYCFVFWGGARGPRPAHGEAEVYELSVLRTAWRRGVGAELIRAALSRLRSNGYDSVTLVTLAQNTRARRFYEAQGWKLDEELSQARRSYLPVEVCYRFDLSADRCVSSDRGELYESLARA